MGWQADEFGSSHDGRVGVLLADGTEPGPVFIANSSSSGGRETTEWRAYSGMFGKHQAAYLRGACSCGWRGASRYPIDWDRAGDWPYDVDESGAREDWDLHIEDVEARTVPLPEDFEDLLARLESRLRSLAADSPAAGLRAVGLVERVARRAGWDVACDLDAEEVSQETLARALGLTEKAVYGRLMSYRPQNLRSLRWLSLSGCGRGEQAGR